MAKEEDGVPMSNQGDRLHALPMYLQISEYLIREVGAGRLIDGERLPPERILAAEFGTTVRTLRKALDEMVNVGMLVRIQGSGNYIRASQSGGGVYSMFRLELPNGGGLPNADVLSVVEMDKPDDLPAFGTSTRATRVRRLRYLDSTPVAVEEIWLDRDCGAIDPARLSDSLYHYYRMNLGFFISRAEDRVAIGPVPEWAPPRFGKAPGDFAGYIQRFSWAQAPRPVEFSRTWFDTDRAFYTQRLI